MRKIISLLLVSVLVIALNVCVYSADEFEMNIDTKTADVGDEVVINMIFNGNCGLVGAIFDIEYDKERILLVGAEDKGLLKGGVFSESFSVYPYRMLWNSSSVNDFTDDGVLAALTFKVLDDAENGDAYINVSYNEDDVFNAELNNVNIRINNGAIKVTGNDDEESQKTEEEKHSLPNGSKNVLPGKVIGNQNVNEAEQIKESHVETKLEFDDVNENDWFYDAVCYAVENNLMNGISEKLFAPDVALTRGMLVTVLYRIEREPDTKNDNFFSDVDCNMYYSPAISWAWQNDIVNGISKELFAPDNYITREQFATIIYRYGIYKNIDIKTVEDVNFEDATEISDFARNAVKFAVCNGLIKGKTPTLLKPHDTATRAETAQILMRFMSKYN